MSSTQVSKLSEAERRHLQGLINKGKSPAKRLLKARILLKADAGGHGEDCRALDTNMSMVARIRARPWRRRGKRLLLGGSAELMTTVVA